MNLTILPESSADYDVIDQILMDAFKSDEELRLVRNPCTSSHFDTELSLVAIASDLFVGYSLFTPLTFVGSETRSVKMVDLGPVAVRSDFQRQGIGTAMIEFGLDLCRAKSYPVVAVLGHPVYYLRFGFLPASHWGLMMNFPAPAESQMVLELEPDVLDGIQGTIRYLPEFNDV